MANTLKNNDRNNCLPPVKLPFWILFDYFWDQGVGNFLHEDGSPTAWTAMSLESAFDGKPDKRSIEYWQSRTNMPSPENIRKLSLIASGGDGNVRRAWYDAFISARRVEKNREKESAKIVTVSKPLVSDDYVKQRNNKPQILGLLISGFLSLGGVLWFFSGSKVPSSVPSTVNIRICDAPYFDDVTKKCSKHVSVFVHGIDEVFLSFDFENVPEGAAFERWWIRNGERVAGRTSYNDEAWPGYTYWRPGILEIGQYVVRIVVEDTVFTQTFFVQEDGFDAITIEE